MQGDGFPGNHVWVFSRWCVVSSSEEGWEGGLGLKDSSPSSDGAWPIMGGALPLFAEVLRLEGLVKLQIPLVKRSDLDFLPTMRPATLEEVRRIPLDCSMLEKEPLGKDLLLKL
jgi:hypothetical protein